MNYKQLKAQQVPYIQIARGETVRKYSITLNWRAKFYGVCLYRDKSKRDSFFPEADGAIVGSSS